MSRNQNPVLRVTIDQIGFQFDPTKTFKAGGAAKYNSGTGFVEPALTNTDGPTFIGILSDAFPQEGQPGGPNDPGVQRLGVQTGIVWRCNGKAGETYKPLLPVVLDDGVADGQSVRLQGADGDGNVIGYVDPESVAAAGTLLAAATGLQIGVIIIMKNGPLAGVR